jgi:thiol-disulfide isomerase/thioredoxin
MVGDPVPTVKLVDLAGSPVDLATFRGAPTLLLFWNPAHAGCLAMLPDLKAWEAKPPPDAPKLLVVSTGTAEANREMGLRSPVVLGGPPARRAFGLAGVPGAVLVDADGRVASSVARGAPSVLDLLGNRAASAANASRSGASKPKKSSSSAPTKSGASTPKTMVGDPAPPVVLLDLTDEPVDLTTFRSAPTLMLFWNPGCGFCKRMLPDLKAWEDNPPEGAPKLLVVSTGEIAQNRVMGLKSTVVLDKGFATGRAFGATGTPSAVLLDAEGKIASPVARGAPAVLALANGDVPNPAAPGNGAAAPKPDVGDPAPTVKLLDLADEPVDLAAFRGTPTLVLFWSPGCGHCTRILDEIKTLEANPPEGAPKLFVVSSGDPERNRAMGFRSTVALDQNFSVGNAFGARGTPSAVLLDAEGKITSPIATGGPAVLALAGARQHELKSPTA